MINRYKHRVGHWFCCGLLRHNYAPVAMRVMARPSGQEGHWQELQWDAKIVEVPVEVESSSSEDSKRFKESQREVYKHFMIIL